MEVGADVATGHVSVPAYYQRKQVHVAQGISPFQDLLVMLHVMFEHADCMLIALCMLI